MKYKLTITAWYLNIDRVLQLVNSRHLILRWENIDQKTGTVFSPFQKEIARSLIKEELESWLHSNRIPSLGELVVKNSKLESGTLFTIYQDFFGKGLAKFSNMEKLPRDAIAELHNKLKYANDIQLRIIYSPTNLTSNSAWSRMSGHPRLFCFCFIEAATENEIIARPYVIGDLHTGLELETPNTWNGRNYGEIHISEIDQFSKIREQLETEKSMPDINVLKSISEKSVKSSIAEIIKEGNVPNDWGGERSDLFTNNVSVGGKHIQCAFLFKGPARFSEMKMLHLGKNGDQIERLFSEPADLLILQHCHSVSAAVRNTMRAFASRVHDLRYFSILDGYDTIRLLKAYKKCGL